MKKLPILPPMLVLIGLLCGAPATRAGMVTFGTGGNQFTMEFVPIGNSGNLPDMTGNPNPAGAVAYPFAIGKYEVSEDTVTKANAAGGLQLTLDLRGANQPATSLTWNEAARYINWLNTSQGYQPAYKFAIQPGGGGYAPNTNILLWVSGDAGYNPANPYRNSLAHYWLPSIDEWYKAAYYDPSSATYFDYPTGSNTAPTPVAGGTTPGTAVYNGQAGFADVTSTGGLSPYGTMAQGGNVYEWQETESDLVNNNPPGDHAFRGGDRTINAPSLAATGRSTSNPLSEFSNLGLRVATVPEPSTISLAAVGLAGLLWRVKRRLSTGGLRKPL